MPLNQIAKACVVGSALPLLVGGGGWYREQRLDARRQNGGPSKYYFITGRASKVIVDYYWMWG